MIDWGKKKKTKTDKVCDLVGKSPAELTTLLAVKQSWADGL